MQAITISHHFLHALLEGYIVRGYNPKELLKKAGIPEQIMKSSRIRISAESYAKLSYAATTELKDESFGQLAEALPIGTFELTARACFSRHSLEGSLYQWVISSNLLNKNLQTDIIETADSISISINCQRRAGIIGHYVIETTLLTIQRFHCWLSKEFIPLEAVELNYPEPHFSHEYRSLFYGAPITYNAKRNAITFSKSNLTAPIIRDRQELKDLMTESQLKIITQPRKSSSPAILVRMWIEKLINQGNRNPQLEVAAEQIGLTSQTLRRRLRKEGTSFQKIKEDTRRDMAIYLINSGNFSVEKIAYKLGYSEASTFIRAFKKWTGLTPLAYRKL
jgi:AraC-like DNA-binding protein